MIWQILVFNNNKPYLFQYMNGILFSNHLYQYHATYAYNIYAYYSNTFVFSKINKYKFENTGKQVTLYAYSKTDGVWINENVVQNRIGTKHFWGKLNSSQKVTTVRQ